MQVGWPKAKELLLTARVVESDEALQIGLVNHLVESNELMNKCRELAGLIAGNDSRMVQGIKQLLVEDIGEPEGLPDWFTKEDLDYVVGQFEQSGFRGGVNYYRNIERNWKLTEDLQDHSIKVPTLFLAGSQDMVIGGADIEALESSMKEVIPLLEEVVLLPNIGHWVQQEAAEETNSILIDFLK